MRGNHTWELAYMGRARYGIISLPFTFHSQNSVKWPVSHRLYLKTKETEKCRFVIYAR